MTLNEDKLKEFSQYIGADPQAPGTQYAFGTVQALHKMITEDVEDGDISCTKSADKIVVSLTSDCFCMRAPFLGEFLSCIQFADKLSILKKDDGFQMVVEFKCG